MQTLAPEINKIITQDFPWIREKKFPCHLVNRAVDECSKNHTSLCNKIKLTGKHCVLGYKSKRKTVTETMDIEPGMFGVKRNVLFSTTVGVVKAEKDFYKPKNQAKIQYNRHTKEWFLILLRDFKKIKVDHKHNVVSIDPGEKVFLCLYCPSGHVVSICEDIRKNEIFQKLKGLDKLVSKRKKVKNKTGYTRAIHRIYKKIKNMKNDMHHKASLYICKNYKNIIIPKYESKSMMSNLNSSVLSTLSFYPRVKKS